MAIDTTYWAADLAAVIADLPTVAKFGSTTFNCAASALTQDQMLLITGNQDKQGVVITFPISSLGSETGFIVAARVLLKYPSLTAFSNYQIVSIDAEPSGQSYNVTLMQDNRG